MAIRFEGLEDVLEAIENAVDPTKVEAAMGKACAVVEGRAKQLAPKGNGTLRNSIQSKVEKRDGEIVGVVFTPLEYAPYIEYGTGLFAEGGGRTDVPWHYQDDEGEWHTTSGMKPQPFMRPAANETRNQVIRILGESIKND